MKMEKYKHAARDVLTPKVGYGLADDLKRAGFWVGTVSNKPQTNGGCCLEGSHGGCDG